MGHHLCHPCAAAEGYLASIQTGSLLQSPYQLDNFIKHTVPDPKYPWQSVFASPSTQAYAGYVVNSALSGSVEVDDRGRTNIVWVAGHLTGFQYANGQLMYPQDAVKVVLSTSTAQIHAYPQSSTQFSTGRCGNCGSWAVY